MKHVRTHAAPIGIALASEAPDRPEAPLAGTATAGTKAAAPAPSSSLLAPIPQAEPSCRERCNRHLTTGAEAVGSPIPGSDAVEVGESGACLRTTLELARSGYEAALRGDLNVIGELPGATAVFVDRGAV